MDETSAVGKTEKIGVILLSGLTAAIALNFFLIPAKVLSAGMNGVAQLIVAVGWEQFGLHLSTGLFYFAFECANLYFRLYQTRQSFHLDEFY